MDKTPKIIDLEFNGIDNTFIKDNEVTQVKLLNVASGVLVCRNFLAIKPVSTYDKVYGGVEKYVGDVFFSAVEFEKMIGGLPEEFEFWGYSVAQDRLMLAKYGIDIPINDMQEKMRLNPDYEKALATGCASMECAYYLLTGKVPPVANHYKGGSQELELLKTIYEAVTTFDPAKQNKYLTLMPWGHCAGMPIARYVAEYRRAADGYRLNNNDLLAKSLTETIPVMEHSYDGDEFVDDDDFNYDDRDEEDGEDDDEDDSF